MKPRNLLVKHMIARKQGAHGKSQKAVRRSERMQLQREYGVNGLAQQTFNLPGQGSNPCTPTILNIFS